MFNPRNGWIHFFNYIFFSRSCCSHRFFQRLLVNFYAKVIHSLKGPFSIIREQLQICTSKFSVFLRTVIAAKIDQSFQLYLTVCKRAFIERQPVIQASRNPETKRPKYRVQASRVQASRVQLLRYALYL